MNNNSKIHNNGNYGIDYTGPCAVMHHQHYQMIDLLIQHCRQSMRGLNPHALPCVPSQHQEIEKKSRNQEDKDRKPNLAQSKQGWKTCNKNKGKRNQIKKHKVKKTENHENRFSRLQDMVKDMTEVMELLSETVKDQNNKNNGVEKMESTNENKDINSYHVDSVEINVLDDVIKAHVESDQRDNEEGLNKNAEKEKIDYEKNHMQENVIDSQKMKDYEENIDNSYVSDNYDEYDDDNYDECDNVDYDEFYSNSDSEEGSVESTFEEWLQRKVKHKGKHKSYSD